jgi:hypothetical protein
MKIHCDGCEKVMGEKEIIHLLRVNRKWYCGHYVCLIKMLDYLRSKGYIEWDWIPGHDWD